MDNPIPVTDKVLVDVGPLGQAEMPVWRWAYYKVTRIIDLGLKTSNEAVVAGTADIDIEGDTRYVRSSANRMVLNWFAPSAPLTLNGVAIDDDYRIFTRADDPWSLAGTNLTADQLTWNGGGWMPVIEPVTHSAPNYAVLGYTREEIIFPTDGN